MGNTLGLCLFPVFFDPPENKSHLPRADNLAHKRLRAHCSHLARRAAPEDKHPLQRRGRHQTSWPCMPVGNVESGRHGAAYSQWSVQKS
jgi:hypothetical protein